MQTLSTENYLKAIYHASQSASGTVATTSIANKIAFNLEQGNPLGGVINVELSGDNLADWLEAATWHKGRDAVPKKINDDRKMEVDGEASTWI